MPVLRHTCSRRRSPRWRLTVVSLAAAFSATVALAVQGAATAHALVPCGTSSLSVPESSSGVVARTLQSGEAVTVEPLTDEIWAGVLFTGGNGPAGWVGWSAPSHYPRPGVPVFSLIGRLEGGSSLGFTYIGDRAMAFQNLAGFSRTVRLRVNDDVPGNGSGAFRVRLHHWCQR